MKKFVQFLFFCMFCVSASSQCDTQITQDHLDFASDFYFENDISSNPLDSVGITFHIYHDGSPIITKDDVFNEFEHVSSAFAPSFRVYIHDVIYYNDPGIYLNYSHELHHDILQSRKVINTINIKVFYYEGGCGFAWYPGNEEKYCVINQPCFFNRSTISHEIGHYLFLYHTHNDRFGTELVDRSNCHDSGDLVCDTQADPKLRDCVDSDCNFSCDDTDPNGDKYDPPINNIMSYYTRRCRINIFTEGQHARIVDALYNIYPHLVNASPSPPLGEFIDLIIDTSVTKIENTSDRINIRTGVKNIGGLTLSDACYLGYYASKDNVLDDSDILIFSDHLEGRTTSGSTNTESHTGKFPPGYKYLILLADHTKKIEESDEENNHHTINVFPSDPPSPPPNCISCEKLLQLCK